MRLEFHYPWMETARKFIQKPFLEHQVNVSMIQILFTVYL